MNPVQAELIKIQKVFYNELKRGENAPVLIHTGEKHELDLFEAFIKSQLSDESTVEDLLLLHYQPFDNVEKYGESLVKEWEEYYDIWDSKQGRISEWHDIPVIKKGSNKTDAYKVLNSLQKLLYMHPDLSNGYIILYLTPVSVISLDLYNQWIEEWGKITMKYPRIKLVVPDNKRNRCINENAYTHTFSTPVDIYQLMQNTAAHDNRIKGSPENDYQQQMLTGNNQLSKNRYEEACIAFERAAKIASRISMKDAEITALFMIIQSHVLKKENDTAESLFQQLLVKTGQDTPMAVQMNMHYATFLLIQSKKDKAIAQYQKTLKIAEKINDLLMQMECCRLVGQLKEGLFANRQSIQYYEQCIKIGKELPVEQKQQSNLAYVGYLLMKKYGKNSLEGKELDNDMSIIYGDNWFQATDEAIRKASKNN